MPATINGQLVDARPDRQDLRDRRYLPPLRALPPQYPPPGDIDGFLPLYAKDDMVLDQKGEGACTGFGLAAVINYLQWRRWLPTRNTSPRPPKVSQRMLYQLARFYDEWPGEDYEGSSCRGAMKGWHRHGVCEQAKWEYRAGTFVPPKEGWDQDAVNRTLGVYYRIDRESVVDMQAAIQEVGALYVSATVHEGWSPERLVSEPGEPAPVIGPAPSDGAEGGHAFALVGYTQRGFVVQNSWGDSWGRGGFAILPYDDWVENGTDAWVVMMGVPVRRPAPRYLASSALHRDGQRRAELVGLPVQLPKGLERRKVPLWSEDTAYEHAIVMGNNGVVINRTIAAESALNALEAVVTTAAARWLSRADRPGATRDVEDIVLYAHGGLNDEAASIRRARILGPYFEANGIYPIFFTWKTGFLESLKGIVGDVVEGTPPQSAWRDVLESVKNAAADARDRTVELACQEVLVKAVWSQMKQNAAAAAHEDQPTLGLTAQHLATLARGRAKPLRLHLVGHSAGSILHGYLLEKLAEQGLKAATCSLFAPACTVPFAVEHYLNAPALDPVTTTFHILDDERERADSVGPYGKSLLYLVSRALEEHHKMPILGMEIAWTPPAAGVDVQQVFGNKPALVQAVARWQMDWKGPRPRPLSASTIRDVADGSHTIAAAHGSFDNDVDVVTQTIRAILKPTGDLEPVTDLRGF
jgi:Papain family cysteine protease